MKKVFWGLGFSIGLLSLGSNVFAESSDFIFNGKAMDLNVAAQSVNGKTFVAVQPISEKLGATTNYDGIYNKLSINYHQSSLIQVTAGSSYANINGQNTYMDQTPTVFGQQLYVPLSFFDSSFGLSAGWNPSTKTLIINDKYSVILNGETLKDEKVLMIGNDLYLNLNTLGPKLNVKITSGTTPGTATVEYGGKSWSVDASSNPTDDNWDAVDIDDNIYVPVSQLNEKLKTNTYIDKTKKQIGIDYNPPKEDTTSPAKSTTPVNLPSPPTSKPAASITSFPNGTFLFIWKANRLDNRDVNGMIQQAKQLGVTGVIIKFANGSLAGDANSQGYMDQFKKYVGPFKNAGFKVGGWIYQYLTDVDGEVDACSQAIQAGADFIVLDAEDDVYNKGDQVAQFGKELRAKYPTIPVGLSSFAFPDLHAAVPFDQYNQFINVMMPQIYWADMQRPVDSTFASSIAAYKRYGKPIAPTGQLYSTAQPADITKFVSLAQQANLSSVSWWDWDEATDSQIRSINQQNLFALSMN
jgi:hypothetical protein